MLKDRLIVDQCTNIAGARRPLVGNNESPIVSGPLNACDEFRLSRLAERCSLPGGFERELLCLHRILLCANPVRQDGGHDGYANGDHADY